MTKKTMLPIYVARKCTLFLPFLITIIIKSLTKRSNNINCNYLIINKPPKLHQNRYHRHHHQHQHYNHNLLWKINFLLALHGIRFAKILYKLNSINQTLIKFSKKKKNPNSINLSFPFF